MWIITSVSIEEAHKLYVISFSPAPFTVIYGRKYREERERGNSRISGKYWEHQLSY
jgi:hypothetical protein